MGHAKAPRRGPTRLHGWLLLFGLLNGVLINLVLLRAAPAIDDPRARGRLPTTLHYARDFLRERSSFDSWRPMRRALAHLHGEHDRTVYRALFFDQRVKFQYAPTSLLLLEPFAGVSDRGLNRISWFGVWAVALACAGIFAASRRICLGDEMPASWRLRLADLGLALLFTLSFYPLLRGFRLGQIQTWIDVLFCGALWAWLHGRRGASGALAGLAAVIKPQLGLLLVWAALRRHGRFAAGWLLVAGSLTAISLWRYGLAEHLDYLTVLSYLGRHGESYQANQSLNGLLHRAFFNGNNVIWRGNQFAPFHPLVFALSTLGAAALVGLALFFRPPPRGRASATDLSIAALSFTAAAPIVWEHHYGIALPIAAAALPAVLAHSPAPRRDALLLALAYALLSNKFDFVHRTALTHANVAQSYLFGGALLLLLLLYRLREWQARAPEAAADA